MENTIEAHREPVWDVAFSPDGQIIVSASQDQTLKLWKVDDGTWLLNLRGHSDQVTAVDFRSDGTVDGTFIVSGSEDNSVRIWKPNNSLLRKLFGHKAPIKAVAFSPDGRLIASGSKDKTVKIWHKDGKLLRTLDGLDGHSDEVNAVVFSPDGQLVISGSEDNTIKIWRQEDGKLLRTLDGPEGHKSPVFAIDISPDGQLIISGSGDNTVKLWTIDGELLETREDHSDSVLGVKFHPNPKMTIIASASVDKTIKLWKWDGNEAILMSPGTLMGHSAAVESIDFSPDGNTLISGSDDRTVILWTKEDDPDSKALLKYGCEWARDYLKNNLALDEKDRSLCHEVENPHNRN